MEQLFAWVMTHPLQAFILYVVFMAAVQALPRPDEQSQKWYVWLYQFAHLLSVNVKLAVDPLKSKSEDRSQDAAAGK